MVTDDGLNFRSLLTKKTALKALRHCAGAFVELAALEKQLIIAKTETLKRQRKGSRAE
jgi:hypothetical protein